MKLILLVGHSGSGKDTILKIFQEYGFETIVSYTTRPPRDYEVNGKDYHFISEADFKTLLNMGFFLEYQSYRDWLYGTAKQDYGDNKVLIVAKEGMIQLMNKVPNIIAIHIKADEEVRKQRLYDRGDNKEEVERRIVCDRVDFKDVEKYTHFTLPNNTNDIKILVKNVSSFIELMLKPYIASR